MRSEDQADGADKLISSGILESTSILDTEAALTGKPTDVSLTRSASGSVGTGVGACATSEVGKSAASGGVTVVSTRWNGARKE